MISMGTDALKRTLREQDELRSGIFLPKAKAAPSLGYSLDYPVADLSLGELLNIIDFQIAGHAFVACEALPAKAKPAKSYELSQGVRDAADHVVGQNDPVKLEKFLKRFPQDQRAAVEAYMARKAPGS